METLKISAVSYLNTLPFVYGIKFSGELSDYDLQLDFPSECARKFLKNEVDIALVPVAALKKMKSYWMLDEFCIGSNGRVRTVVLLSKDPLNQIKRVHLDYHSLTSVNLVKILANQHWKINPKWVKLDEMTEFNMLRLESLVAIGDKIFILEKEFEYVYDLATEWKNFSGLPFVFACWVVQKNMKEEKIKRFIKALEWGVNRKQLAIEYLFDTNKFPTVDINEYLEKNIDFVFDAPKRKALDLFLNYME
jgi:chorismate dehydratase